MPNSAGDEVFFMRQIRTDLAMEAFQGPDNSFPGVHVNHWETMGIQLTEVAIETEAASQALGKAVGTYMTLECDALRQRDLDARLAMSNLLGEEIARMLHREGEAPVLVVGLGNRRITPDSLGPQAVDRTLVTRHMFEELPGFTDERMRNVCAIAPGVLGVTGIETMEMAEALVARVHPQAILCIDSLAARASSRIGAAVQLTDTGIRPGSGVGNHRRSLTREALGVPVIAIGMPTVLLRGGRWRGTLWKRFPRMRKMGTSTALSRNCSRGSGATWWSRRARIDGLIARRSGCHRLRHQPRPAAGPQPGRDYGDDALTPKRPSSTGRAFLRNWLVAVQ